MTEEKIQQMNLKRVDNYGSLLYSIILERYKVLPLISTLSSVLIGLVIQGTDLVKVQSLAFISFIIFLILIPLSVFAILYQLSKDFAQIVNRLENIRKEFNSQQVDGQPKAINLTGLFLWILFYFFSLAIILFVLSFFDLNSFF